MNPRKNKGQPQKTLNPIVAEFLQSSKVLGFTDEDIISDFSNSLSQSETSIRLVNKNITQSIGKVLLRLFQRYTKIQSLNFFSCLSLDPFFLKQLSIDLLKSPINSLILDYMAIPRESIIPFLSCTSLDLLSLRGNQCLTSYDFLTHQQNPFPLSLNLFFNSLSTSNLKVLNLYGCNLGDDGTIAFAYSLYFNTNLKAVCLSRNKIGDNGAIALASALSSYILSENECIIVDRLMNEESKQRISDEGTNLLKRKKGQKPPPKKNVPKVPKKNQLPTRSNIEKNISFDPKSPIMPAILSKWNSCFTGPNGIKILPGNNSLTTLLLDENEISRTGALRLSEMLKSNIKISNFSILNNPDLDASDISSLNRQSVPDSQISASSTYVKSE